MKFLTLFFLTGIFFTLNAQAPVDSKQNAVVFKNVNIIPMDTERVIENQDVVVKDGKIVSISPAGKTKFEKGATIVEAKGKYLIPGLAEIHAHVPPVDDIAPMKDVLTLFAANGVTTIRGMLGHPRHIELRAKIESGEILGPRFYTSGPSFNGISVKSPEQADKMVREQKAMGYDFLKMHPGLTIANFDAVVKTAHEVNIPFAGHVSWAVGVWRCINAGYASIDHMDGFIEGLVPGIESWTEQEIGFFGLFASKKADVSLIPKLTSALKEKNIYVVPTQALAVRWMAPDKTPNEFGDAPEMKYMDAKTVEGWVASKQKLVTTPGYNNEDALNFVKLRNRLLVECQKSGVRLLLGSDAPQVFNVPGFSIHHELRYLVDAGLTPYQALTTGTVNVAEFFHHSDWGTIKAGNVSDLVLLNGNPLKDITQTTNIEGVMLKDKWLSKAWINAELKKLEKR